MVSRFGLCSGVLGGPAFSSALCNVVFTEQTRILEAKQEANQMTLDLAKSLLGSARLVNGRLAWPSADQNSDWPTAALQEAQHMQVVGVRNGHEWAAPLEHVFKASTKAIKDQADDVDAWKMLSVDMLEEVKLLGFGAEVKPPQNVLGGPASLLLILEAAARTDT